MTRLPRVALPTVDGPMPVEWCDATPAPGPPGTYVLLGVPAWCPAVSHGDHVTCQTSIDGHLVATACVRRSTAATVVLTESPYAHGDAASRAARTIASNPLVLAVQHDGPTVTLACAPAQVAAVLDHVAAPAQADTVRQIAGPFSYFVRPAPTGPLPAPITGADRLVTDGISDEPTW